MKLFLDSANLADIKEAIESGAVSGVTTNPSIIAKEPKADFVQHCRKIADICDGRPLSVEVFATAPDEMIEQGIALFKEIGYADLNIKIPVSWENLRVIRRLTESEVPVNTTCIFTEAQALAAANAGARYVSFFVNRMKDLGLNPFAAIRSIRRALLDNYMDTDCEIICGSIRSAKDIVDCILADANIVTAGVSQLRAMCVHPGTDFAVNQFNTDFAVWIGGSNV